MTKNEFLARCSTAYDMGLIDRMAISEFERTNEGLSTLASDRQGYALQQFAAILAHPCQKCAEDVNAWHTRAGFCEHRGDC